MAAPVVNEKVVTHWLNGLPARNHRTTFHTDGQRLYSYALQIGDTDEDSGFKVLRDHTAKGRWDYHSQTTSCHVGLARRGKGVLVV